MGRHKLYTTEEERKSQRAAYQRKWRKENPEKFKQARVAGEKDRHTRYYNSHRKKVDQYKTMHRNENKDRYNELARERQKVNPMGRRISDWKRRYGLTFEQFEHMRITQDNRCKTCRTLFVKTPHVDHCHKTGAVRGLLCGHCNRILGLINESTETLRNMIIYLETPNGSRIDKV